MKKKFASHLSWGTWIICGIGLFFLTANTSRAETTLDRLQKHFRDASGIYADSTEDSQVKDLIHGKWKCQRYYFSDEKKPVVEVSKLVLKFTINFSRVGSLKSYSKDSDELANLEFTDTGMSAKIDHLLFTFKILDSRIIAKSTEPGEEDENDALHYLVCMKAPSKSGSSKGKKS